MKYINNSSINAEIKLYQGKWNEFKPLEKAILFKIANGFHSQPSSKNNLEWYSRMVEKEVNKKNVSYALNKLKEKNILFKDKQSWFVTENGLKEFIKSNILDESYLLF